MSEGVRAFRRRNLETRDQVLALPTRTAFLFQASERMCVARVDGDSHRPVKLIGKKTSEARPIAIDETRVEGKGWANGTIRQ